MLRIFLQILLKGTRRYIHSEQYDMLNLFKNAMYFKEQRTKNESAKQPDLIHDEVQRVILHAAVMGWPVEGGPSSPEAHDHRV